MGDEGLEPWRWWMDPKFGEANPIRVIHEDLEGGRKERYSERKNAYLKGKVGNCHLLAIT